MDRMYEAQRPPIAVRRSWHTDWISATALSRARRLLPDVQGELVPRCSHDMCFRQRGIVDARVLEFLKKTRTDGRGAATERSVA